MQGNQMDSQANQDPVGTRTSSFLNSLTRLFSGEKNDGATRRFIRLFADHGVRFEQIPQLLPQLTPEALSSQGTLRAALTPQILSQTASLFGVRRAWLDGTDNVMYTRHTCYKEPQAFFKNLSEFRTGSNSGFCVRALSATLDLDRKKDVRQDLALVLVKTLTRLGDTDVYSYAVCGDAWDWSYAPGRLQLKAMARLVAMTGQPIPLIKTPLREIEKVREGLVVPQHATASNLIAHPFLDDYAQSAEESNYARETEELEFVVNYIQTKGLSAQYA